MRRGITRTLAPIALVALAGAALWLPWSRPEAPARPRFVLRQEMTPATYSSRGQVEIRGRSYAGANWAWAIFDE
jgi:hypothetical protein